MDFLTSTSTLDLLSRVTYTCAILTSVYLIRRTNSDPNPVPAPQTQDEKPVASPALEKKDFLMTAGNELTMRRHLNFLTATGIYHAFVSSLPAPQRPALCPAYMGSSVNTNLFTWTSYTASILALLVSAGLLRLAAYSNLGRSFTFYITKPSSGLKTTGVHGYVRHPSYTALLFVGFAMVMLLFRERGLMGCWFPEMFARSVDVATLVWAVVINPILFWLRVKQEEEFLERTFGAEWEGYCKRTKRFIPGVF
ncbi:hypothetical protein BDV19DRAFT_390530 [Aspergillus venezuelensis]